MQNQLPNTSVQSNLPSIQNDNSIPDEKIFNLFGNSEILRKIVKRGVKVHQKRQNALSKELFQIPEVTQIKELSDKIIGAWKQLDTIQPPIENRINQVNTLKKVIDNPLGIAVAVGSLGVGLYFVIDQWDEKSKQDNQKSIEDLAVIVFALLGVTWNGGKNLIVDRVKSWNKGKKLTLDGLIQKTKTSLLLLFQTQFFESFLHHRDPAKLHKHLKNFINFLESDLSNKHLITPQLLITLGELKKLVKEKATTKNELFINDEDEKEISDFITQTILPLLEKELVNLNIKNRPTDQQDPKEVEIELANLEPQNT